MLKGTMGNIFQCCQTLSNLFKCQDTPVQGGAEQSPLLSSDESECESPSLPYDLDDGLLTVSSGVTNPALEPEHFLFPDIILSSNPGGEVTLVEPMVCLLVSEEEEGQKVDVAGDATREMSFGEGRDRSYSEVETQTEAETHIGMTVQTQTESQAEVQTQTEILKCNDEIVEQDVRTLTNKGITKETDGWERVRQADVFLETRGGIQTFQKQRNSAAWDGVEGSADVVVPWSAGEKTNLDKFEVTATSANPMLQMKQNTQLQEELNTDEGDVFKLQQGDAAAEENSDFAWTSQHPALTHLEEKPKGQNTDSECTSSVLTEHKKSNMDDFITTVESHGTTKHSAGIVNNLVPVDRCKELQSNHDDEKTKKIPELSCLAMDTKDQSNAQADETADLCILNMDDVQRPGNSHMAKTGLQEGLEMEAAVPPTDDEKGAEMKQMTLFLVDRLFLAAPHVKGVYTVLYTNLNVHNHCFTTKWKINTWWFF